MFFTSNSEAKNSVLERARERCLSLPRLELRGGPPLVTLLGLAVLYASAYFLPLTGNRAYFLPSRNFFALIVLPSAIAIAALLFITVSTYFLVRAMRSRIITTGFLVIGISLLIPLAVKGALTIVGYSWEGFVPFGGGDIVTGQRYLKIAALVTAFLVAWSCRSRLRKVARILASVGFAFLALATVRLAIIILSGAPIPAFAKDSAPDPISTHPVKYIANTLESGKSAVHRRVVWILFDETDLNRLFSSADHLHTSLPNFEKLAERSIFAERAASPASATLYSVPSLLMGAPLGREGVSASTSGTLIMHTAAGKDVAFGKSADIFSDISALGYTSSVLGFYHPYCRLFVLSRCDSFPWPGIGDPFAAIVTNVPNSLLSWLGRPDPWMEISQHSVSLLPEYLGRNDALTFVHLNFPHLPAAYADELLKLKSSTDPLIEYSHNLRLTDEILGQIVEQLSSQESTHELLLIVSTDHWLRSMWYQMGQRESSRPIPFIIWKVGADRGIFITNPINTVITKSLILEYLQNRLTTQAQIAEWLGKQVQSPSYIAAGG